MKRKHRIAGRTARIAVMIACCIVLSTSVISAVDGSSLSAAQKDAYYAQYGEIIDTANYISVNHLELTPKEEMSEEDWIDPDAFRAMVLDMAEISVLPEGFAERMPVAEIDKEGTASGSVFSAEKTAWIVNAGVPVQVKIQADFDIGYSAWHERPLITGVSAVMSEKSISGAGTWEPEGYVYRIGDGGRTCHIYVFGKYTIAGLERGRMASAEFYLEEQ